MLRFEPLEARTLLAVAPNSIITGAGTGGGPHVRAFDAATLQPSASLFAVDFAYSGGVRVAAGDVNADGIPDLVTTLGPGTAPIVRVFSGANSALLMNFAPYASSFTGGVYVATGDVNGDGRVDIITAPGFGGGPHVRVFSGVDGSAIAEIFPYAPAFTGGITVAAGDVNGDGKADIITGAGYGGGPHVRVLSGATGQPLRDFFAYAPSYTGGVNVASGDVNADGRADIVTGTGFDGGPHVRVFSGANGSEILGFMAYHPAYTGGISLAVADLNGDHRADIITGPLRDGGPHLRAFSGLDLSSLANFFVYSPAFTGGIFVAGSSAPILPVVTATLANDTGNPTDRITSDPSIQGNIQHNRPATKLLAGFDAGPAGLTNFIDVIADVQPGGAFTLTRGRMDQIAGGVLADGVHRLFLQAEDQFGNRSQTIEVVFQLDSSVPQVSTIDPAAGTDLLTNVPGQPVVVRFAFDEPILAGSLAGAFEIVGNGGQIVAPASVTYDGVNRRAVITLPQGFVGPKVEVRLKGNTVRDSAGNFVPAMSVEYDVAQFQIVSLSPEPAETEASLTRPIVIEFNRPVNPATVNASTFFVSFANQSLPGTVFVNSTGLVATFVPSEAYPANASLRVTVDGNQIRALTVPDLLDADRNNIAGGVLTFDFSTSSATQFPGTSVSGQILAADGDTNPTNNPPVAGATITVLDLDADGDGVPDISGVTDAQGRFTLENVPVGAFHVLINGYTATNAPPGYFFSWLQKPLHSVQGQATQIDFNGDGVPDPIILTALPNDFFVNLIEDDNGDDIDDRDTVIGLSPTMLSQLPPELQPLAAQYKITVPANNLFDAQGNPITHAGLGPISPDQLPSGLPSNFDPRLALTLQTNIPGGNARYDRPMPLEAPNLDNLPAGTIVPLVWFDHQVGEFLPVANARVEELEGGGTVIRTLPGEGVQYAGWGFVSQPVSLVGVDGLESVAIAIPAQEIRDPEILVKLLVTGQSDTLLFNFAPPAGPSAPPGQGETDPTLTVEIFLDGVFFDDYYINEGPNRIRTETFVLRPGDPMVTRTATLRSLQQLLARVNEGRPLEADRLYGAKIEIHQTETRSNGSQLLSTQIVAPYFLVDQSDDNPTDGLIKFPDTVITADISSHRDVELFTSGAPLAMFVFEGEAASDYSDNITSLSFNPSAVGDRDVTLEIDAEVLGQTYRAVGSAQIEAIGRDKQRLYADKPGLIARLEDLAKGNDRFRLEVSFADMDAGQTYRLMFGGQMTAPLRYDAPADAIRAALEALPNVEAGEVSVRLVSTRPISLTAPGGNPVAATEQFFEIEFSGGLDGTNLTLDGMALGGLSIVEVTAHIPPGTITPAEKMLFDNLEDDGVTPAPNERSDLADAIESRIIDVLFGPYADGFELADSPGAPQTITVNWSTTALGGLLGESKADPDGDGVDNAGAIEGVVRSRDLYSKVVQNFLLDQAINQSLSTSIEVYVDTPLEFFDLPAQGDARQALVNSLSKTVAHEAGHTLGGRHTYKNVEGEIREVVVNGAMGRADLLRSSLDFAGGLRFLEGLTGSILQLAFNLGWSASTAQLAMANYVTHYSLGAFDAIEGSDATEAEEAVPIPGALLAAKLTSGLLVSGSLDFGSLLVDGVGGARQATTLVLQNFGTLPVTINSLQLQSAGGFSTTGITPGTVVNPGASVSFDIAFDPLVAGAAACSLLIQSTDDVLPLRQVLLTGVGLAAGPVFELSLAGGNNNLGGVEQGQTKTASGWLTVRNPGSSNLTFTANIASGLLDYSLGSLAGVEQTLASGASISIPVTFHPSRLGLLPGSIRFTTNDPAHPIVTQGLVGTGVPEGGVSQSDVQFGDDYIVIVQGGNTFRVRSSASGAFQVALAPHAAYSVTIFDPATGFIAAADGFTGASGSFSNIVSPLVFRASTAPDSDGDGFPDDVELAIGSSPLARDSDQDGLSDSEEIAQQLDPLDGQGLPVGVIGLYDTPGEALDLVASGMLVYVADGTSGLQIIDVTNPSAPTLVGQVDTPGTATRLDTGIVGGRTLVAIADDASGVQIVDVTDPPSASLVGTVSLGDDRALAIKVVSGIGFVGTASGEVVVVDLASASKLGAFAAAGTGEVTDLDYASGRLWTLRGGTLAAYNPSLSMLSPTLVDTLATGLADARLFLGGSVALVIGQGGASFRAVNIANAADLQLFPGLPPNNGLEFLDVAADGAGFALAPATDGTLRLFDVRQPSVNLPLAAGQNTFFVLSGTPRSVALKGGLAYVATADGGLEILNYRPLDGAGQPPTINLVTSVQGITVVEGNRIRVEAQVADDVQIRGVQLFVNGQPAAVDLSYPYTFLVDVPELGQGAGPLLDQLTLQAVVTDTAGNQGIATQHVYTIVSDTAGPALVSLQPVDSGPPQAHSFDVLLLQFNERLNLASATNTANYVLIKDDGDGDFADPTDLVIPLSASYSDALRAVSLHASAALPAGTYRLRIKNNLMDPAGNRINGGIDLVRDFSLAESVAAAPFAEIFATAALSPVWAVHSTGGGQVRVTAEGDPRSSPFHLAMESTGGVGSLNELVVSVNLAGMPQAELSFYSQNLADAGESLPATFTGSTLGDGVSISRDGVVWHRVVNLANAPIGPGYTQFFVDLDAAAAAAGISLTSSFRIRFQQYTAGVSPSAGRTFDDIRIGADVIGPQVFSISPVGPLVFGDPIDRLVVTFNEPLAPSAANPAHWQLVGDGPDDQFGTADDGLVQLSPQFDGNRTVTLVVTGSNPAGAPPLAYDTYWFTARSTLVDLAGNSLADGLDFVRFFDLFPREVIPDDSLESPTATGIVGTGLFENRAAIGNNGISPTDVDLYRLDAFAGQMITAAAESRPSLQSGAASTLQLRLLDAQGMPLATSASGMHPTLLATVTSEGVYFIEVTSTNATSGLYDLTVVGQVDSPITFSGPTVVEADGLTVDTIIGHTTLLPGTLVTITSSMGTLLTDASQEHTGFQAVVSGQGLFFIDIRRPLAAGIPTLTAQAIDAPGEGTASDPNVLAYVLAGLRRFDFNETLANVTAAGFSPVLGYDTYSPERGYGWAQPVQEFDRGDGNYSVATVDLYRDGHSASTGTQRTFRIQVQSGVTYDVRVYVGDQSVALDQVQIATEVGTVIAAPDTPAGAFTSVLFTGLFDVNDDGVLDMTISDQGGLATGWAINGLDIADAMVGLPPTALLLIDGGALSLAAGEELASSGSGDLLTLDGLAPLVAEAIARWRGAGIDDVQLALLQSVTFEIADLDSQGFLGLAGSRRIVLDDNAAGYGWFIDPTAWDDDEFEFIASSQRQALDGPAADNIDLLTVILHELGHVLGLGDLHPSVSEHDLMTDRFSPGLRRTPDRASLDALFEQLGNED